MMGANAWLTGTLTTFIVAALCLLAILASVKWYRPEKKISGLVAVFVLAMVIGGLASFDMLGNGRNEETLRLSDDAVLYKQLYWQSKDNAEFAHSESMKLWSERPNATSKLLLGLSYLQSGQKDKGIKVIEEVAESNRTIAYLSKAELESLAERLPEASREDAGAAESAATEQLDSEYAGTAADVVEQMKLKLSEKLDDVKEQQLLLLAQLDPNRLHYVYKASGSPTAINGDAGMDAHRLYEETANRLTDESSDANFDSEEMVELAKTAIYLGDERTAQVVLSDVLAEEPQAIEPAVLLGELMLNERSGIAEEQIMSLPAYAEAKLRQQKEEKRLLKEWSDQVKPGDSDAAAIVQERLQEIQADLDIAPHLAYALLQPHEGTGEPQVQFLLSEYYYQMNDHQTSGAYIRQLADNPSKLTHQQQYYVQSLQSLPEAEQMSLAELQTRNDLTAGVYKSFQTLEGKRLNDQEPTDQEKGFAVHLSNELIQLHKSSIRISSIQASEDGEVSLYVTADNLAELSKKSLSLKDNSTEVSAFTIEKVGESVSNARNMVVIMDRSGSMEGERIEAAKLAVQNFIESMNQGERVGFIAFSDYAEVLNPISDNVTSVGASVGGVAAGGGTNIAGAFEAGLDQIELQEGERVLFLLSDGEDATFSMPETRAAIINRAGEAGVTVFAIGFGAGYETLRDVAEATGGRYIAAAGLNDLLSSFDEIKSTLAHSYKITYELSPIEVGLHRVRVTGPDGLSANKTYTIGQEIPEGGIDGPLAPEAPDVDAVEIDFAINGTVPSRITASKLGTTTVQISGIGFDHVEKATFDKKDIKFTRVSDSRLEITLSNNLSIGIHEIKLIASDQREAVYNLSVTKSGDQQFRAFGDAMIYGDFIEDEAGVTRFLGNTSVDHFIYDSRGSMTLQGGRELSFSGLMVDVDKTKIGLVADAGVKLNNWEERNWSDGITMTLNPDQKTFDIARSNIVSDVLDKYTLGKFGLEVYLAPQFTYEAKYRNDDGTLKGKAGIKGFNLVTDLIDLQNTAAGKWMDTLKFLPSDANLEIGYEKDNIIVAGELGAAFDLNTLIETGAFKLTAAYEHGPGKLDLGMEIEDFAGQFRTFSFDMGNAFISKVGVKIGWQGGMMPKAGELMLGSNNGVPLASTGMTVRAMKVGIDTRDGFGGLLGTEVGTTIDGPVQEVIGWINKVPGMKIDAETACVLCVEGEAGVARLGTPDWAVEGKLGVKVLGFVAAKGSTYMDASEISSNIAIEGLGLEGNTRLLWRDYSYNGDLTITTRGSIDLKGLEGDIVIFIDTYRIKKSYVDVQAKVWKFEPHIHFGDDPAVYR